MLMFFKVDEESSLPLRLARLGRVPREGDRRLPCDRALKQA